MTTQDFLQKELTGTEKQIAYAKTLISKRWDECIKWHARFEAGKPSTLEMYNEGDDWNVKASIDAYRALLNETNAGKIIEMLKKV